MREIQLGHVFAGLMIQMGTGEDWKASSRRYGQSPADREQGNGSLRPKFSQKSKWALPHVKLC